MITQKDIARQLGVSPSLVSRVLAGTAGDIGASAETMRRIQEEAARVNYRPNAAALTLRGTSTKTIGVIVKNFEDPFFGHMIRELQGLALTKQYSLVLAGCPSTKDQQIDAATLLKYQLDGVVIVGSDFEPEGLDTFSSKGIPVVQIGAGRLREGMVRVVVDQKFGLEQLVVYLEKLGHRDIGYIGDDTPSNMRREAVARQVLKNRDLVVRLNAFVRVAVNDVLTGYEAMQQLLHQCGDLLPTAIIAADDVIAQTALRALFEKGIRVPNDLSLAGFDDIPSARMTIPALTTLRQPIREMVGEAFLLATSHPGKARAQVDGEIVVKPELVLRESCAPPHNPGRTNP
jgi:LacI family transcriptional regulator